MKLTFDVKNQIITRTDHNQVIANSGDYLEAVVSFSDDWATLEKTMTFKNGDELYTIVLANDQILQENHLNLGVGTWKVSIIGIAGDQKIITNECNVAVNASGWIGSDSMPPESVWNQLLVIIQSLHTEAASTAVVRSAVQKYIEDNYDSLVKEYIIIGNVQEIIEGLVEDGTISDLIAPFVTQELPGVVTDQLPAEVTSQLPDVVADQISGVVADQLPDIAATAAATEVGAWLTDHIDPDTGYVIDDTLTTVNAAADAKKVGDEITDLKSAFNFFVDNNFNRGFLSRNNPIFTEKAHYNASSAGWVSNGDYYSYYFLTDRDCDLWTDTNALTYYAIAIYNGEVSSANYVARYRKSDSNLPTEDNKLHVTSGQTVVVTIYKTDTDFELYTDLAPVTFGTTLENNVESISNDILNAFTDKNFSSGFLSRYNDIMTSNIHYNASSSGWVADNDVNSFYFNANDDCYVYTKQNNLEYYAIAIYNGEVSSTNYVARYRKSDSNLPTEDNKLHVTSGQTVVVTISIRDDDFELFTDYVPILLGNQMIAQVIDIIGYTQVYVSDGVYTIMSNGIQFTLEHTVNAVINSDCWRFTNVSKNNVNLVSGDIIGVLLESGQADFMGGVHGDEHIVDFKILADGTAITEDTTCKKVTIYMHSHLYRPSSPDTNVVDRYVNITIENGTMTVENTFKCLVDGFTVQYAFNSGLIGVYKANVTFLSSNTDVADLTDMPAQWNDSHDNYWYDVIFTNGLLHVENIIGREQANYHAYVQYYSNENPQRLKMYLSTDNGSIWNTGHICNGKFVYVFE